MKKVWVLFCLTIFNTIIFLGFFSNNVNAGEAGVGVGNIPPKFNMIRLTSQDDNFRVYLTVFDHNSWEDIQTVSIILEDNGIEKTELIFKQYETNTSYYKINEFSESSLENNLLITKKCSYDSSYGSDLEKCDIDLLFVFENTYFTLLKIIAVDTNGGNATIQLDYTSKDLTRSGNILIIPGIDKSIIFDIPSYLLDIIAIIISIFVTWYILKKTNIKETMRSIYEET